MTKAFKGTLQIFCWKLGHLKYIVETIHTNLFPIFWEPDYKLLVTCFSTSCYVHVHVFMSIFYNINKSPSKAMWKANYKMATCLESNIGDSVLVSHFSSDHGNLLGLYWWTLRPTFLHIHISENVQFHYRKLR